MRNVVSFGRRTCTSLVLVALAACGGGGGGNTGPGPDTVSRVDVNPAALTLPVGENATLNAVVFDGNQRVTTAFPVTWSSTSPGVATVDGAGRVTAVGAGVATIRASAGGETGQATVTAVNPTPPNGAPNQVVATVLSDTEIDVDWVDNSTDEDFFRIEREVVPAAVEEGTLLLDGGDDPAVFAEVGTAPADATSFRDSGLEGGTMYRYIVRACNVVGCNSAIGTTPPGSTSDAVTTEPGPLSIDDSVLSPGVTSTPYSRALRASGGIAEKAWSLAAGSNPLPPGLALSVDGVLSGTPTQAGTFLFTVEVESGEQTASKEISLTIIPEIVITTDALPNAQLNGPYLAAVQATGGSGTIRWTFAPGSSPMPPGLSLSLDGLVSGVATTVGTFTPTFRASTASIFSEKQFTISVTAPAFILDTEFINGGSVGEVYAKTIEVTGDGPFTFTVVGGALPDGLALGLNDGQITGTPTVPGAYYFTLQVQSGADVVIRTYAMAISNRPSSEFNIEIVNVAGISIPSDEVIAGLSAALARWEQVITGDLPAVTFGNVFDPNSDNGKMNGQTVDDLVVMVNLAPIDGSGGTLGSAGPRSVRFGGGPSSTIFGRLTLDVADLASMDAGRKLALTFHEIGHIVGIGTLWDDDGLISGEGTPDPRYEGAGGNNIFVTQLGGGSDGSTKIPIEGSFGSGTRDSHWDEGEFNTEVMTGFLESNGIFNEVSAMTIAAVGDLGYTVDVSVADAYVVPVCAPTCSPPALVRGEGPLEGVLLDDIEVGPIAVVFPDGRVQVVDPTARR